MNSGFPSLEAASESARSASPSSPRCSNSLPVSSIASCVLSGSSETVRDVSRPPAHVGREVSSSGREVAIISSGTSCTRDARYSIRSSKLGSLKWMSSKTIIVGRSRATASTKSRAEK